jgi:hypothetical protein
MLKGFNYVSTHLIFKAAGSLSFYLLADKVLYRLLTNLSMSVDSFQLERRSPVYI